MSFQGEPSQSPAVSATSVGYTWPAQSYSYRGTPTASTWNGKPDKTVSTATQSRWGESPMPPQTPTESFQGDPSQSSTCTRTSEGYTWSAQSPRPTQLSDGDTPPATPLTMTRSHWGEVPPPPQTPSVSFYGEAPDPTPKPTTTPVSLPTPSPSRSPTRTLKDDESYTVSRSVTLTVWRTQSAVASETVVVVTQTQTLGVVWSAVGDTYVTSASVLKAITTVVRTVSNTEVYAATERLDEVLVIYVMQSGKEKGGLSTGAIVGIGVAAGVATFVALGGVWWFVVRVRRRILEEDSADTAPYYNNDVLKAALTTDLRTSGLVASKLDDMAGAGDSTDVWL